VIGDEKIEIISELLRYDICQMLWIQLFANTSDGTSHVMLEWTPFRFATNYFISPI
jgi:hypothetical protein